MAMAYATSMLPISQGALETSISTWRLLFIWYIDILYTCSKNNIYIYTIIPETISLLSTNIAWFLSRSRSNNKDLVYHLLKHMEQHTISTYSMMCVALSHCAVALQIQSMFLPFLFCLVWAAAHATSRGFSGYVMPSRYCPRAYCLNFARFCRYAVLFPSLKKLYVFFS